jgi:hypothetical protein
LVFPPGTYAHFFPRSWDAEVRPDFFDASVTNTGYWALTIEP